MRNLPQLLNSFKRLPWLTPGYEGTEKCFIYLSKVSIWPKCVVFFSVFISLECIEEYLNFSIPSHFRHKNWAFKISSPATPNEDDWELLSPGPEQAMTSLQESSTLPVSIFQCFIVFPYKRDHFPDYLRQEMIDFVWKNNEILKWRVDDPWSDFMACSGPRLSNSRSSSLDIANTGSSKHDFVPQIWMNRNFFFKILF